MIKGLDRPMFRDPNRPQFTGLEGFYGQFGGGQMPQSGIMKFAPGGEVSNDPESVAANLGRPPLDLQSGYSEWEELGKDIYENPGETAIAALGLVPVVGTGGRILYTTVTNAPKMVQKGWRVLNKGFRDKFGGEAGSTVTEGAKRAKDWDVIKDPVTGEDIVASSMKDAMTGFLTSKEGAMTGAGLVAGSQLLSEGEEPVKLDELPIEEEDQLLSQASELNPAMQKAARQIIADNPETFKSASAVTEQVDKGQSPANVLGGAIGQNLPEDPDEADTVLTDQIYKDFRGAELGIDRSEISVNKAPHNAIALMLAGFKMMQSKGNLGTAIGEGGEAGVSYLANVAEKEAERAADLQRAQVAAEGAGRGTSDIQNFEYNRAAYKSMFPKASDTTLFSFLSLPANARPESVINAMTATVYDDGKGASSPSVASNYARIIGLTPYAQELTANIDPKVAYIPTEKGPQYFTQDQVSKQIAVRKAKNDELTDADAAWEAGFRGLSIEELSKANLPKK